MVLVVLRRWLPLALLATLVIGTSYTIGQQGLRLSGNDPQIQLAEDAAARLGQGAAAVDVVPAQETDIASSLAPWLIVYGPDRKVLASSARLDGREAEYVRSVLDNVHPGGQRDDVTWQPRAGVRAATVVVAFGGGWVVAGRSLRLVEERIALLANLALAAWLATLVGTAAALLVAELAVRRLEPRPQ